MDRSITPFDAVLLIAFGGPRGRADIRPFLDNVLRGRPVTRARREEVARHYELFDGVSPLAEITARQADGLRDRLEVNGPALPVYVGMRNWHPFLADTLEEMARAGVKHAIGFIMAAYHSYASCGQYRQNVADARAELRKRQAPDVELSYVGDWYNHQAFIGANARRVNDALERLPNGLREKAHLVVTAHSIPQPMAEGSRYEAELRKSAQMIARMVGTDDWELVFQSRSGRLQDPWLGPDICDYLRAERNRALEAVVICPLGFVADHIEVLYDLDHEAAGVCQETGLPMSRAATVNDDPLFLDMVADVVRRTHQRYANSRPLPIIPSAPPNYSDQPKT